MSQGKGGDGATLSKLIILCELLIRGNLQDMLMGENSQVTRKSAKLVTDVGRPRIRPPGEKTTLSFQVEDAFLKALDEEALRLTAERGPGARKVSRSEMVTVILAKWMAERSKKPSRQ